MNVVRARRPQVLDATLALGFTAAVMAITTRLDTNDGDFRKLDALAYALIAAACGSLIWRRRAPRVVLAVSVAAIAVYAIRDYTGGPVYIADLFAMYTVASVYDRRTWLTAAAAAWLGIVVATFLFSEHGDLVVAHLLYASWLVAAGFFGDAARSRREYLEGLEERNRHLVETQQQEARRQVAEERLRIARDLHDVVAHSLSSIHVQAGAGAHVGDRRPEQAISALQAIKQASGEALGELRATVGMLRADDEAAPRAPAPSLRRLGELVERTERAGLRVDVRTHGSPDALPEPVDAAAFRIVQESLTNVLRHAGTGRASVSIAFMPGAVTVDVCDNGSGRHGTVGPSGHGIAGMHERATALGGTLHAGPRPEGGFRVSARLPTNRRAS